MIVLLITDLYPNKKDPTFGSWAKNLTDKIESQSNIEFKIVSLSIRNRRKRLLYGYLGFFTRSILALLFAKYDKIFVHHVFPNGFIALLSNIRKKSFITMCHGRDLTRGLESSGLFHYMTKLALNNASDVIFVSKYMKDLAQDYSARIRRSHIINCGIDFTVFSKKEIASESKEFLSKNVIQSDDFRILFV